MLLLLRPPPSPPWPGKPVVPVMLVGVLAVDPAGVLIAELGGRKGVIPFEFGADGSPEGIVI